MNVNIDNKNLNCNNKQYHLLNKMNNSSNKYQHPLSTLRLNQMKMIMIISCIGIGWYYYTIIIFLQNDHLQFVHYNEEQEQFFNECYSKNLATYKFETAIKGNIMEYALIVKYILFGLNLSKYGILQRNMKTNCSRQVLTVQKNNTYNNALWLVEGDHGQFIKYKPDNNKLIETHFMEYKKFKDQQRENIPDLLKLEILPFIYNINFVTRKQINIITHKQRIMTRVQIV